MKILCNNGNTIERFYEYSTRSSVVRVIDPDGNQIGDADYSGSKASADWATRVWLNANGGRVEKSNKKQSPVGSTCGSVRRPASGEGQPEPDDNLNTTETK